MICSQVGMEMINYMAEMEMMFFREDHGIGIVIDSNVTEGDDSAGNCKELLNNIVVPGESPQIGTTG
jgi:hypothetical protein